jgi:hypothetical protein
MSADPKEKLLLDAEWEDAVMDLQDSEKVHKVPADQTSLLCIKVLRYLQTHRVRDKLFWERKGDEFHAMIESLAVDPFTEEQVERVLQDDEFWSATLKLFGVVLPKNE